MTIAGGTEPCAHDEVLPAPCDQTVCVECWKCRMVLDWCWGDRHIPESLWNRACAHPNDLGAKPCEQSRDDVCAICSSPIGAAQ